MEFLSTLVPDISLSTWALLALAIGLALTFEFVNGFHDTANAVATVIYTQSLPATPAVVWSGVWNLIGVLTSSGAVAFGIVAVLPVELVMNVGSGAGFAMVFSLLLSAITWNLGTWWLGLPASSSHTLIGSIIGVGVANALMGPTHSITDGVNWSKAQDIGLGLMFSPLVGFAGAALLLIVAKVFIRNPELYRPPEGKKPPPLWIRSLLILTCTGVSFAHGSNDGQKGMGLIMLILVGILPGTYALKLSTDSQTIAALANSAQQMATVFSTDAASSALPSPDEAKGVLAAFIKPSGNPSAQVFAAASAVSAHVHDQLSVTGGFQALSKDERITLRTDLYLIAKCIAKLEKSGKLNRDPALRTSQQTFGKSAEQITNFIPGWVIYAVALALGLGTMVGYQRIVKTVGEKIGKDHLTYAQGASAELVAMSTILVGDHYGLPISTTHVLSSGIAGTMAANNSGLQMATVRNILMAWVLTLPVCIFLGAVLFAALLNLTALLGFA